MGKIVIEAQLQGEDIFLPKAAEELEQLLKEEASFKGLIPIKPFRVEVINDDLATILALPLEEIGLQNRTRLFLFRKGYHTVGEVWEAGESKLSSIKGLGPEKMQDIKRAFKEHGLELRP